MKAGVGRALLKTHGFGFETLDEEAIQEGHEGPDRFECSLCSRFRDQRCEIRHHPIVIVVVILSDRSPAPAAST